MNRSDEPPADRGPLKDELVAYLDGELDAETSRELENLLATDPVARDEMHRMEQAWDLLDQLPRAEVDEAFTHSTIEMVAVSAAEEVELLQNELPRQRRRRLMAGVVGMAVALTMGFFSVQAFWLDANEQLLRDLPVLERLDQYRQIDSVDFLRQLSEQELLPAIAPASLSEPTSMIERQMLIEQLSPADKESLLRKQERFAKLPSAEQERIRNLHAEIQNDPEASTLRGALSAYYDWLLQLSVSQRAGLASLETTARIERIEKLRKDEQQRELSRLSPADLEAITGWLEEQVLQIVTQGDSPLPVQDLAAPHRRGALMLFASSRFQSLMGSLLMKPETLESLRSVLSPQGQAKLAQLDSDEKRRRVLMDWRDGWFQQAVRDAIKKYHDSLLADVQKEDLVRFYMELPADERDNLDRITSSEFRESRLRFMYLQKHKADQIPEFARELRPEWWTRGLRSERGEGRSPGFGPPRDGNREGGPPPGPPRRGPGV